MRSPAITPRGSRVAGLRPSATSAQKGHPGGSIPERAFAHSAQRLPRFTPGDRRIGRAGSGEFREFGMAASEGGPRVRTRSQTRDAPWALRCHDPGAWFIRLGLTAVAPAPCARYSSSARAPFPLRSPFALRSVILRSRFARTPTVGAGGAGAAPRRFIREVRAPAGRGCGRRRCSQPKSFALRPGCLGFRRSPPQSPVVRFSRGRGFPASVHSTVALAP